MPKYTLDWRTKLLFWLMSRGPSLADADLQKVRSGADSKILSTILFRPIHLNTYQDTRFTICPRCKIKTRARKFSLVIHVSPHYTTVLEKMCRFCDSCDLLIVHQDQLEQQLTTQFLTINPEAIGNDYQVAGTLERAEWSQGKQDSSSFERLREYQHDFKEVITFRRVPVEEECL
jgi:hypothetical protein